VADIGAGGSSFMWHPAGESDRKPTRWSFVKRRSYRPGTAEVGELSDSSPNHNRPALCSACASLFGMGCEALWWSDWTEKTTRGRAV
jgi:hypothetical protein